MKEIVDRLTENRQVELAKSILESKGYKVKKLKESEESEEFEAPVGEYSYEEFISSFSSDESDAVEFIEDMMKEVGFSPDKCTAGDELCYDSRKETLEDEFGGSWTGKLLVTYDEGGYYSCGYAEEKNSKIKLIVITSRDGYSYTIVENPN